MQGLFLLLFLVLNMKKVFAKFDNNGICRAVYQYNFIPDLSLLDNELIEINDDDLKKEIIPNHFIKSKDKISRIIDNNLLIKIQKEQFKSYENR